MDNVFPFVTNADTALPTAVPVTGQTGAIGEGHGIPYVLPLHNKKHPLALADRYFTLRNGTPGTGIITHTAPDMADNLKPCLHLRNSYTDRRLMLDYILLTVTAAGGSDQTAIGFKVAVEPGGTTRYASAGTAYTSSDFHSPYSESQTAPTVTGHFGAIVATAESNQCRSWFRHAREVDRVVGDNYVLEFGAQMFPQTSNVLAGTTQANIIMPFAPVILGPNAELFVHEKAPSQTTTAAAYEFEVGFWLL